MDDKTKNKNSIIWIDNLSISALPVIHKIACKNAKTKVCFLKSSYLSLKMIKILQKINHLEKQEIDYNFGDMWEGDISLGMKLPFVLPEMAGEILQFLKTRQSYKTVTQSLSAEKLDLYLELKIRDKINSLVKMFLIADWHKSQDKNGKQNKHGENVILYPKCELSSAIDSIWDKKYNVIYYNKIDINSLKRWLKKLILYKRSFKVGFNSSFSENKLNSKPKIALHYVEGINLEKRSDIFWYFADQIDSGQVMVYFNLAKANINPVKKEVCEQLEGMGIKWVSLDKKALSKSVKYKWQNLQSSKILKINMFMNSNDYVDRWIVYTAKYLKEDVEKWRGFYKFFNIKIVVDLEAYNEEFIAQNIALDLIDGIRIGIQRSTLALMEYQPFLQYNANHLFFIWNKGLQKHKATSKIIKKFIVSGYPFDSVFKREYLKIKLRKRINKDVKFIIALFGSVFTKETRLSRKQIISFHTKFLNWLLEDEEIAIISKEKKPASFSKLTEIKDLVTKAEKTGRYISIENSLGRFPVDASCAADMAVGLGISSAVNEAVITGCRGLHCDLSKYKSHPFYEWGYEKIIFDDQDRLINSLKLYKREPEKYSELGSWSLCMDNIDVFRDGEAGKRIGSYIQWLIEAFNCDKNRDQAIEYSDKLYAQRWGEDKVIDMGNKYLYDTSVSQEDNVI